MDDEKEQLMKDMWKNWKPYNQGANGKWRSYVVADHEADLLESQNCVTLVNGESGLYVA